MTKAAKIWIWFAIVLCTATTVLNATEGRITAVFISIVSIIGLAVLVLAQKKWGFYLTCAGYVCSFITAAAGAVADGTDVAMLIVISFFASLMVPGITFLFLRKDLKKLK